MRIPVLKALVERASKLQSCEDIAQEVSLMMELVPYPLELSRRRFSLLFNLRVQKRGCNLFLVSCT